MGTRLRRLGAEGGRFVVVNVAATCVALTLFNLLTHGIRGWFDGPLHGAPIVSYLIAHGIGMLLSFWGSSTYVFAHRRPAGPGNGFVNYAIVNLASFSIPVACLAVSRSMGWDSLAADNISGNLVGSLLGTVFRYWAFRRFVFKRHTPVWTAHREPVPGIEVWMGCVDPDLVPRMAERADPEPVPDP